MNYMSNGMEKCNKCGRNIDKTACNNEYAVITVNKDDDESGKRKQERAYVCYYCVEELKYLYGIHI